MGLRNTLAAAVAATAGGLATMAAAADAPEVENIAVPAFTENLAVNSVTPDAPAYTVATPGATPA